MNQNDYLEHYGVLGMRWGRRKGRSLKDLSKKTFNKVKHRKKIKDLSDEELQNRIRRLQLEKQYRDLKRDEVSEGRKIVGRILSKTTTRLGSDLLYNASGLAINKAVGINLVNVGKKKKTD